MTQNEAFDFLSLLGVLVVGGIIIFALFSSISHTGQNVSNIKTYGIDIDTQRLDWGIFYPGQIKTETVKVISTNASSFSVVFNNWNPEYLKNFFVPGAQLTGSEFRFTLELNEKIRSILNESTLLFSFDIVITPLS